MDTKKRRKKGKEGEKMDCFSKSGKREKGAIVIVALIFIVLCMVAGSTYLGWVTNECRQMKKEIDSLKTFFLAEAGVQYGRWKIKIDNPDEE